MLETFLAGQNKNKDADEEYPHPEGLPTQPWIVTF